MKEKKQINQIFAKDQWEEKFLREQPAWVFSKLVELYGLINPQTEEEWKNFFQVVDVLWLKAETLINRQIKRVQREEESTEEPDLRVKQ